MKKVCWPYFDPEFDKLPERLYGPPCRVVIDNEALEDCTLVKVDSVKKQDLLLEVVEILADLNIIICKCHISSDAGTWFMDVFHVKDKQGNKVTEVKVINYIKQAILCAARPNNSRSKTATSSAPPCLQTPGDHTDAAGPALLSEISAALSGLGCSVLEAQVWAHNAGLACVAYASRQASTTSFGGRDKTSNDRNGVVRIEWCKEREYWIVSLECRDRTRLMFDTLCVLTHLNYSIFHASFASNSHGFAFQEYFVRHVDGKALITTESDKQRIIKCLEAAIQRRLCKGIRLEVRAEYREGLVSDISRVLRENGVADVAARGEEAVKVGFCVRHVSGNKININNNDEGEMELVDDELIMKQLEMTSCPILVDLQIITNYIIATPEIIIRPSHHDHDHDQDLSLTNKLKSRIHRFSHNLFNTNIN